MSRTKKQPGTHRIKLTATISPETMAAIKALTKPGDGLGQTIDRAVETLKEKEK